MQKPDADFEPNLVNTVCFLVQWVVQLTTFSVNYIGHPFNQSLVENKGLALALRWGMLGYFVAVINLVPYTDWALSLVRLRTQPDPRNRLNMVSAGHFSNVACSIAQSSQRLQCLNDIRFA